MSTSTTTPSAVCFAGWRERWTSNDEGGGMMGTLRIVLTLDH